MASFFRWRIADKVIPFISRSISDPKYTHPGVISSMVRIFKSKGESAQLFLPWNRIKNLNKDCDNLIDPKELVKLLRNQGLPTAEGFTDIQFSQEPFSIVFSIDKHVYSKFVLSEICTNEEIMAKSSCLFQDVSSKSIIVQCSVPPVGQHFHMGHFRSAIHSNFIANINKAAGHEVKKVMHVAHWGMLSALILTGFKKFGIKEDLLLNPAHHLCEVLKASRQLFKTDNIFKKEVRSCFRKMKEGHADYLKEWNDLNSLHLEHCKSIYEKIGLTFDDAVFESSYSADILEMEEYLVNQKLITLQNDGTVTVNIPVENGANSFANNDIDPVVINFSRAICTYIHLKSKHNFDKVFYVNPAADKPFLSIVFNLIKALGHQWSENLHHVAVKEIYDMKFKGKKKSFIDVLSKAEKEMMRKLTMDLGLCEDENLEKIAAELSISSLYVYDMNHKRRDSYDLDYKKITSLERNSGNALQLCHAGLKGLQEDTKYQFNVEIDTSPLLQNEAHVLVQHLSRFDEAVYSAYSKLEPCEIVNYLFYLWIFFDRARNSLKLDIKEDRLIVLKARLMLLEASQKVMHKGLSLLGVTPFQTNYTPPDLFKE